MLFTQTLGASNPAVEARSALQSLAATIRSFPSDWQALRMDIIINPTADIDQGNIVVVDKTDGSQLLSVPPDDFKFYDNAWNTLSRAVAGRSAVVFPGRGGVARNVATAIDKLINAYDLNKIGSFIKPFVPVPATLTPHTRTAPPWWVFGIAGAAVVGIMTVVAVRQHRRSK